MHYKKLGFSSFLFIVLFIKIISPRNNELQHWCGQWLSLGFKPVIHFSKHQTYSTLIGEDKDFPTQQDSQDSTSNTDSYIAWKQSSFYQLARER